MCQKKFFRWHGFCKGQWSQTWLVAHWTLGMPCTSSQSNGGESSAFWAWFCVDIFPEAWDYGRQWGWQQTGLCHIVLWEVAGNSCLLSTENRDKFSLDNLPQMCMFITNPLGCWSKIMPVICSHRRRQFCLNWGSCEPWQPKGRVRLECSCLGP